MGAYETPTLGTTSAVSIDPITNKIFVGDSSSGNLVVLNATTGAGISMIPTPVRAAGMAIDNQSGLLFVAGGPWNVAAFNTTTDQMVGSPITVGRGPIGAQFDYVDDRLFVADSFSADLRVFNATTLAQEGSPISLPGTPAAFAYDTIGDRLFVALSNGTVLCLNARNSVWFPSSWHLGGSPTAIAIDPSSDLVYVSDSSTNSVSVLNTTSGALMGQSLSVGAGPDDIIYYPPDRSMLVADTISGAVTQILYAKGHFQTTNYSISSTAADLAFDSSTQQVVISEQGGGNYYSYYVAALNLTRNPPVLVRFQVQTSMTSAAFDPSADAMFAIDPDGPEGAGTIGNLTNTSQSGNSSAWLFRDGGLLPKTNVLEFQAYAQSLVFDPTLNVALTVSPLYQSISFTNATSGATTSRFLGAGSGPSAVLLGPTAGSAYLLQGNSGGVRTIDIQNDTVSAAAWPTGQHPTSGVFDQATGDLFIANCGSDNVTELNGSDGAVVRSIAIPGNCPDAIAQDPATGTIWVTTESSPSGGVSSVTVLNATSGSKVASIAVGFDPVSIVFDPYDRSVCVVNEYSNNATAISDTNYSSITNVPLGTGKQTAPDFAAYDPAERAVFVTTLVGSQAYFIGEETPLAVSVTPAPAEVGHVLTIKIVAMFGSTPFSFVYAGLPSGCVSQNSSSIECVPLMAGNFSIRVQVLDSQGASLNTVASFKVYPLLGNVQITVSPAKIDLGQAAQFSTSESGGEGPDTFYYTGLPSGCTTEDYAMWNCTPASVGSYSISVEVVDQAGTTSYGDSSLVIESPVLIDQFDAQPSTFSLGASTVIAVGTQGGVLPYTFSYDGLPPGCQSADSEYVFCAPQSAGQFNLTVNVTDSGGGRATSHTHLSVVPAVSGAPIQILSFGPNLSLIRLGASVAWSVHVSGGAGLLTYAWFGLPDGCVSASAWSLNCTPTEAGDFGVAIEVEDSRGDWAISSSELMVVDGSSSSSTPTPHCVCVGGVSDDLVAVGALVVAGLGFAYLAYYRKWPFRRG